MQDRTLERIKAYLTEKEGFSVLEVSKSPTGQHVMLVDSFGFFYSLDLTPLGRIEADNNGLQLALTKTEE